MKTREVSRLLAKMLLVPDLKVFDEPLFTFFFGRKQIVPMSEKKKVKLP